MNIIALRYLQRRNKSAERRMLERSDENRYRRVKRGRDIDDGMDAHDVEALLASFIMTPSWERETQALRQALSGRGGRSRLRRGCRRCLG